MFFLSSQQLHQFFLEKLSRQNKSSQLKASKEEAMEARAVSDQVVVAAEVCEERSEKIFKLEHR